MSTGSCEWKSATLLVVRSAPSGFKPLFPLSGYEGGWFPGSHQGIQFLVIALLALFTACPELAAVASSSRPRARNAAVETSTLTTAPNAADSGWAAMKRAPPPKPLQVLEVP